MINLRSFLASLFIHSLIIFSLLGLFRISAESSAKYIEIDFSLANLITNSLKGQGKSDKKRGKKISKIVSKSYINRKQKIERRVKISKEQKPILKKDLSENLFMKKENKENLKEEDKQNISMSENVDMVNANEEKEGMEKAVQNISMIKNVGGGGVGEGEGEGKGGIGEDEGGAEKIKEKFLLEKLLLISKIVQNNITYPYIARKMGWEGKVIISFVLTKDGKINFLVIEKSSGYDVLDKNAVETIKKVSQYFPLPPLDVKIKLPISYKLK
ncbi:hypothetical protein DRN73_06850 [Candidatus Pacearchaeota archaeon]|nr:MAG: hypothetical protein DRN73_06850 [Candidatus Pacearchaeota archaeon]